MILPDAADAASGSKTEKLLKSMSTTEKIEQMITVSVRYYQKDGEERQNITVLPDETAKYLASHHFGGVILFSQSTVGTEQTVRLIDSIQKANTSGGAVTQLLMGVDQEGGDVSRLNECVQGPGNMALAATGVEQDITDMYSIIGTEVSALGFNVDFCPDADVNSNPSNPIIGVRSFSDDANIVSKYVKLSLGALQNADIIACPKHFPGHGDTNTDSHTGLPRIDRSYSEIRELELLPFRAGIDEGTEMIMTAHARGTGLTYEAKTEPQPEKTYSNEWVQGKWYDKNGNQAYTGIGSWKKNKKGWWYQDTKGWYPKNRWQKIDGKWYYFNSEGYMAQNEFIDGWWIGKNGAWTYKLRASWKKNARGWWYGDSSGWYAKNAAYCISGKSYSFDKDGYWVVP